MKINTTKIDGSGNIVVQGVSNQAQVTINTSDSEEFKTFIQDFFGQKELTILVLTHSLSEVKSNFPTLSHVEKYYQENLEDWKPFENQSLLETLKECAKNLRATLRVHFIQETDILTDENITAYFKYAKRQIILIVDVLALKNIEKSDFIQLFNDYYIGGCLLVLAQNIASQDSFEKLKKSVFPSLFSYKIFFAGKPNIEKTHFRHKISEEYELKNAIVELALNRLEIKPNEIQIAPKIREAMKGNTLKRLFKF